MMTHQSLIPWLAPSMNSHVFVAPRRPFWWRALSATIVSATLVFAHGHAQAQTPTRTSTTEQAVPLSQVPTALIKVPDGRLLAPDIARIVTNGELVVAMLKVDTPPFFFFNEKGDWVGLEVDLAEAIAKELGVKLRINRDAGSFNAVVDILAKGEADLAISKLSRTLARTQTIAFSNTYLTLNHALLINRVKFAQIAKGRALPEVVRSFDGSIGVIAKSSFADYARRNFPKAKVQEYPTWNSVLVALQKGEVAGAYRDEFEIKRVLNSDPTASLVLRTVTLKDLEDTLGIGVGVSSPRLLAFVNEFLAQRAEKLDITKVLQALERK
ncbi:MAG: ABC transporter substrate-binding protein [Burkholderiaceae bacterium]|nr:ABC transporter substrate-binding protein [Burkholderiaceae bacterium]